MPSKRERLKKLFQGATAEPCNQLDISKDHKFVCDLDHGNPNSILFFCGEAPGKEEDEKGIPFVGKAGKFFNKHLERIGLARENVWTSNILKYRPTDTNY